MMNNTLFQSIFLKLEYIEIGSQRKKHQSKQNKTLIWKEVKL